MKRQVLLQTALLLMLVGGGLAVGWWLGGGTMTRAADEQQAPHAASGDHAVGETDEHDEHEDEEHLHLTREAYQNLQIRLGTVSLEDYVQTIRIPGEVVEIPGQSSRSIAAPVTGIVNRIYVEAGQVVPSETALMEMEITDEELISGQVALLDVASRLEVSRSELDRLSPLAESGTIAGRRHLELQYEAQKLEAELQARTQELRLRGLTKEQIASVQENRELVQRVVVRLAPSESDSAPAPAGTESGPGGTRTPQSTVAPISRSATSSPPEEAIFTVERLGVHPGMSVTRGQELCRLGNHRWLYVRGEAFEEDIASITRLRDRGWTVAAEFGHQHAQEHQHLQRQEGLHVAYVDNHVDPETRTFRFYLRLANEVAHEYRNESGVLFREWQYKPGQLAHLFVPVEEWQRQIKLPLAAIVEEGPSAFVFRRHEEPHDEHAPGEDHDHEEHEHEEPFIEFEPVEVRLLHKDAHHAILGGDGELQPGQEVAFNGAYQLRQAMKMQSGEGAPHHQHDH